MGDAELQTGRVLTFQEDEYRFGRGVLRIQVTQVHGSRHDDGHDWVQVTGVARSWDGRPQGWRTAYIRADKLRAAQRG